MLTELKNQTIGRVEFCREATKICPSGDFCFFDVKLIDFRTRDPIKLLDCTHGSN